MHIKILLKENATSRTTEAAADAVRLVFPNLSPQGYSRIWECIYAEAVDYFGEE